MRFLIKQILFTILSLYAIAWMFPQVRFSSSTVLILTGAVLTLLMLIIRPVLKIVFLPINIITFGLFAWMINMIVLYLAVLLVPGFHIGAITIPSLTLGPLVFPVYHLTVFWSFFFVSFLISIGNGFLAWLL